MNGIVERVIVVSVRVESVSDRLPRLPGDPQDDEGDCRADQRIGNLRSECDKSGSGDDPERDGLFVRAW